MAQPALGLLIDYGYCSGCRTCEVACQEDHGYAPGEAGIRVLQDGPREYSDGSWQYDYVPVLTSKCDLCGARVAAGKLPTCVKHCAAAVMQYGPANELTQAAAQLGRRSIMLLP
jgi:Fe-S-cluster-containing dehydrogenase component